MRATNYMNATTGVKQYVYRESAAIKNYILFFIQNSMYCIGLIVSVLTREPTIYYNLAVDVNMTRDLPHKVRRLNLDHIFKTTSNLLLCKPIVY
jgi:hypothetical protein